MKQLMLVSLSLRRGIRQMAKTCSYTGCTRGCYGEFCLMHKPRKAIKTTSLPKQRKPLPKPTKRIKQKGKRTLNYEKWRDTVAKPYLTLKFGLICTVPSCTETENLHVDHIQNRGSHPELKMELTNVQFLCFEHHRQKTDHVTV